MCTPRGPSAEQKKLQREQTEALERQEEALRLDKKRVSEEEVKGEISRRRSGASTVGLFGTRAGFGGGGGGSMFKPRSN